MSAVQQTSRFRNAWKSSWRGFYQAIIAGDVTALLLTIGLLLMPALALRAADWPLDMTITVPTLVLSIFFGYFLARSSYNELFALIVSTIYSFVTVLVIAAFLQEGGFLTGMTTVLTRSIAWTIDAASGGINQDNLVFSLVVSLLFWFFGYNSVWHIFRVDRVWRVVIPPAMIMLVNLVVYTGDANLETYLLVFVFLALLLVVRSNVDAREWDWYVNGIRVPRRLRQQFMWIGAALSIIAVATAFLIPAADIEERLAEFQELMAQEPVQRLAEFWSRLIEPIEADGPATADYYGGDSLSLGGAIRLGDQVIMRVSAPTDQRYYWRSRVFEQYASNGRWTPSATRRVPDLTAPLEVVTNEEVLGRERMLVAQTVTMSSATRLFYAAPQPISVDQPGRLDVLRTNGDQDDPNSPMNVSVIRPAQVIESGESYTVTSAVSVADAIALRQAGTAYPDWVRNPNMSTAGVNGRVASLAQQIVETVGATNPYDQAKAIETYLRREIAYNETIPAPPAGVDPIEWFLFVQREGYCTYYATSMVTMLRSLGIPARMAAGFSQGEFDPLTNQYIVRERDAHTWVEVYFPGYGWIEFEPTAAQQPLDRDGDEPQQPFDESLPPSPTNEPTETPTPLPSATPLATNTPEADVPESAELPATPTPLPSPTPTATPVIAPTTQPPVAPPDPPAGNPLAFLLRPFILAVVIFSTILAVILVLLFLWWMYEWRGLRNFTPIARAYARLERYLALIGFRNPDSRTPEERREDIVRHLPQAERPVTAITRAYMRERYGRRDSSPGTEQSADEADQAWSEARTSILRRWLRRFVPWLRN